MANRGGLFRKSNQKSQPELMEQTITQEEHADIEDNKKVIKQPAPVTDKNTQDR